MEDMGKERALEKSAMENPCDAKRTAGRAEGADDHYILSEAEKEGEVKTTALARKVEVVAHGPFCGQMCEAYCEASCEVKGESTSWVDAQGRPILKGGQGHDISELVTIATCYTGIVGAAFLILILNHLSHAWILWAVLGISTGAVFVFGYMVGILRSGKRLFIRWRCEPRVPSLPSRIWSWIKGRLSSLRRK